MRILDEQMKRTKALPAAAASASSDSVDLGADRAGALGNAIEAHIEVPALANLVEDKDVDIEFEDSADDSSFAPVPGTGNFKITGGSGDGAAAKSWRFYLPPDTRRYVRVTASVETGGGDNTGSSVTLNFRV